MKAIILSIYIFAGCAFAASAQSKTADVTMDPAPGYGKYMDVQPLTVEFTDNKKMKYKTNPNRINPKLAKPEQGVVAETRKKKFKRVEGKLATEKPIARTEK